MNPRFLFSVHDVVPVHLPRLQLAEKLIEELGISRVCYLLVPDFHNSGASSSNREFVDWCRKPRNFSVEWFLHGFSHLEAGKKKYSGKKGIYNAIRRYLFTDGEAEFLELNREDTSRLLVNGTKEFKKCLGEISPQGFVAPAWLFNQDLLPCLAQAGISLTEDHRFIYDVRKNEKTRCPVITWATRTAVRKYGSFLVCGIQERLWKNNPLMRIAVHPSDFEHRVTVANIRKILERTLRIRTAVSYSSCLH
ncbi:DUF2334 domain-containing protein [Fibrobacterota bacterium]